MLAYAYIMIRFLSINILIILFLFIMPIVYAQGSIGGRVTAAFPCTSDIPGTTYTITLQNGFLPVPVIYTPVPGIARANFLPGLPGISTLGTAVPLFCLAGFYPAVWPLYGLRATTYGSSF